MNNRLYSIQDASRILGVSTKTLRRWDQRGRLVATRTAGNQRRYTQAQIDKFRSSTKNAAAEVPPLFSENAAPKEFKTTHALPSVLSGLPSGSILRNHFLLKHKEEIKFEEGPEESSEPASFTRGRLAKLEPADRVNPVKMGFVVGMLVLFLSFAGAVILVKYNVVAGLSEKRDQFAKFINNLPQISLEIRDPSQNSGQARELGFVPPDLVGSVLAAAAGGADIALNVNIPAFFSQNVGIGTATPDTSAILDLVSEDKGFLAPRMTEVQLEAITTPATGLFVYNTDTNHYNMYNGTSWQGVFTAIGDSTTGEAFTETGTSGTALYFFDADGRGQLTIANLTGARKYTLPDAEGEISLLGQTISNAELVNSKVTVSPGTNMTGGGEVALGSSVTLTLKDSVALAGTLTVSGATTLSSTLAVTGNTTLTGDLAVNGADITTTATTFNLVNATATTLNIGGAATTVSIGAATGTVTLNNATTAITGALTANGNVTLGDGATDTITFTGRVAQDSDLIPIGTTGTNDLGSSSLPWDNIYADNVFAASSGTSGYWQRNSSALSPTNITDDILIGATATSSALIKLTGTNVAGANSSWFNAGNVGIGDTSPDYLLELSDATNTPAFALSDDDIVHGVTDVAQTDVFAHLSSISTTAGGAYLQGLADASGVALQLRGIQSSDPTDTVPAISFIGAKASGTGVQDLASAETVFQVANNDDTAALTILGSGNVGIGTVTPTTFKLEIAGIIGPTVGSTYDIGSSARRFATIYADTGNFTNIAGVITGGSTTSADWLINSDNTTADTEDATLTFERGTPATNSQFRWNSTTKQLSTNSPSFAILPDSTIAYSGTSALMVNQIQAQDIFTASASGTTRFTIENDGDAVIAGDLAVNGGDITTTATTFNLVNATATTVNLGGAATTALNIGNGNTAYTAINIGSGTGGNTINIAGTGATGADTINIGTGATGADTINLGSSASTTAVNVTTGTGAQTFTSNVVSGSTTTSGFVFDATAITSGTGMYAVTDSVTTGRLLDIATSGNTWTGNGTTNGLINIASTSTGGTASSQSILLNLSRSGANANTAHTAYGVYSNVTNTNATSGTNIAGYFSASGATTANYGLIVENGSVGIGTTAPGYRLHVVSGTAGTYFETSTGTFNFASTGIVGSDAIVSINDAGNQGNSLLRIKRNGANYFEFSGGGATANLVMTAVVATVNLIDSTVNALNIESGLMSFDTSNSRVGIGNTTPLTTLDVTGSASLSANLSLRGSGTAHTFNILDNGTLNFQESVGGDAVLASRLFIDDAETVLNDAGADRDFRIESDTSANLFTLDAGLFTGVGNITLGAAANNTGFVVIDNPAFTSVASTNIAKLNIENTNAITVPTGTTAIAASLFVGEPNLTATGTITNAVTAYIEAAPTEGTSNYALWVDAGTVRFDDALIFGADGTAPAGTNVYAVRDNTGDLTLNALTGKTINLAINGTDVAQMSGTALAFQQASTISTTTGALTLDPATTLNITLTTGEGTALAVGDGTTNYYTIDARTTVGTTANIFDYTDATIVSAANALYRVASFNPGTLNVTGNIAATSAFGHVEIRALTLAGNTAGMTFSTASGLVVDSPIGGTNVTITDSAGVRVRNGTGTLTNLHGIYVEAQNAGSTTNSQVTLATGAPTVAAAADIVQLTARDFAAGDARLYVQSEAGSYIALGNDRLTFQAATAYFQVSATNELTLTATALSPSTSDGNALGTGSLMWADLFLASGAVINFNNGAETITHSANTLTVGGTYSLTLEDANTTNNTTLKVSNTSNTAATAEHAIVDIAVGGNTTIGDPQLRFTVPGGFPSAWYMGVDNNNADTFFLGTGTVVGTEGYFSIIGGSSSGGATLDRITLAPTSMTIAGSGGARFTGVSISGATMTSSTATNFTSTFYYVNVGQLTFSQSVGAYTIPFVGGVGAVAPIPNTSVTVTDSAAFIAANPAAPGGTLTNSYGFYVDAQTRGTNNYGAYINTPTGTIARAIQTTGGDVMFGSAGATAQVFSALGTALLPGYSFHSSGTTDPNTGMFSSAADTLNFAAGGVEFARFINTTQDITVFNEDSGDIDFRIESDTNANAFGIDAGLFSGVGQVFIGATGSTSSFVIIDNPAVTAVANDEFHKLNLENTAAITIPTGTAAVVSSLRVDEPNITATGTVTTATTLYIPAAPTEGASNYALFADAGNVRFDGTIVGATGAGFILTSAAMTFQEATTVAIGSGGVLQFANTNNKISMSGTNMVFTADGVNRFIIDGDTVDGYVTVSNRTGTGVTSERRHFIVETRNLTMNEATTIATFRKVSIAQDTYVGTAGGATETVTDAATLYIAGAPITGANAAITNPYALWVDAGTSRFDGAVALDTQRTLTADSTTPSVSAASHFITANTTNPTLISNFTSGANGQLIVIELGDSVTDFDCTASNLNCGPGDITIGATGDIFTFMYDGTNWNLISWMDTSTQQTGADIAELFPSVEALEPGDMVVADTGYPVNVRKSAAVYEKSLLGIVSTDPGITLGQGQEGNIYPVALVGRVPVKVSLENGPIVIGDPITSSSTPGIGMKATAPGRVVGLALEPYDPTDGSGQGKIMVFVNPHWQGTDKLLALDGNDRLGIGTTTPSFRLDVQDMQIASPAAQIFNTDTGTSSAVLVLKLGNTSTDAVASTNHFISFETSGIGIVGSISGNGGKGVTYATSGVADFAEYFKKDASQTIPFGSVVCLKDNGLAVPCDSNNNKIIGVASEAPAFLGGINLGASSIAVGLVGQVETSVSSVNGDIKPGDPLALGSTPGVAVKAIKAGQIIGKAVQGYSGVETGKILVSVNVSWYDPSIYIASDGTLGGALPTTTPTETDLASQGDALQAQVASTSAQVNYVLENDPIFSALENKVSSLESKLDLLSLQMEQQASTSGLLAQIGEGQVLAASDSASLVQSLGDVELNNATISEDLMVLGRATVTSLGVTGNINAGLLAIHGIDGEINTLSGDLYLQKDALGGINIFDGRIVMDTKGNMTVAGTITAKQIEAENYTILGEESIGSSAIPAGATSIEVTTEVASSSSKIFLSATSLTDKQITVVEKSNGRFKVAIPQPTTFPISFDWWIVGNK